MKNQHDEVCLPNFIIIGAAKAGTTALYYYLKQHPEIYMSPLKETNFFALMDEPLDFSGPGDHEYINRFSITDFEGYVRQFVEVDGEKAIGEASPLYLYSSHAAQCIHEYIPQTKIIAILRHPIERAYSAFLHLVRDGRETELDFKRALEKEEERIQAGWEHIWHYKHMGLYYHQLKRYYDVFDRSQIKVCLYYDFRTDPIAVFQDIFRFVGVDDSFVPDMSTRYNSTRTVPDHQKPPLSSEVWTELYHVFHEDMLKLQDLIGRDLSRWINMTTRVPELQPN